MFEQIEKKYKLPPSTCFEAFCNLEVQTDMGKPQPIQILNYIPRGAEAIYQYWLERRKERPVAPRFWPEVWGKFRLDKQKKKKGPPLVSIVQTRTRPSSRGSPSSGSVTGSPS